MKKMSILVLTLIGVIVLAGCTTGEAIGVVPGLLPSGVAKDDLFLLAVPSTTTYPGEIIQYMGADKSTQTNPKIKFKQWSTGETLEYVILTNQLTIKLGGKSFLVKLVNPAVKNSPLQVDFDGNGTLDVSDQQVGKLYYKQTSVLGRGFSCP